MRTLNRRTMLKSSAAAIATAAVIGRANAAEFSLKYGNDLPVAHPINTRAKEAVDAIKAATNGRLAWRHKTGGFVYSSPAVASVGNTGPTVYIGSYDGKLYALNAQSGRVRWARNSGGRISGAPAVIGDLVFYSNLKRRSTAAVGARTGQLVWKTNRGAFNPVISDGRRLYLVGYSSLFMLAERAQARRDARVRLRDPVERRRARNRAKARAERSHKRQVARRVARRKRALARRVAARQRRVARNRRQRREHREVCFRSGGRTVCRVPRKLVCFTREADDRTVCRPRKP